MRWKHAILAAACVAMCLAPLGSAQAQKKKKNQVSDAANTQAPVATGPLTTGRNYFYVTIRGNKQGIFKGQTVQSGHQGQITGFQFLMQLSAPQNMATGQASGKRQYAPVTFTKEWDASSPQIFEAVSSNEVLSLVEFDFVRAGAGGQDEVYETIKLTNATISAVKRYMGFPDAGEPPDPRQLEDVSLTFSKIEISNNDGKTVFMDDWNVN
jgi:type VI secretion system secreted protein Hcp